MTHTTPEYIDMTRFDTSPFNPRAQPIPNSGHLQFSSGPARVNHRASGGFRVYQTVASPTTVTVTGTGTCMGRPHIGPFLQSFPSGQITPRTN